MSIYLQCNKLCHLECYFNFIAKSSSFQKHSLWNRFFIMNLQLNRKSETVENSLRVCFLNRLINKHTDS